jgi:hypothetical protein
MQLQASFAFAVTQVSLSRAIADALGQKTIEMARHYAKGADLRRKMQGRRD